MTSPRSVAELGTAAAGDATAWEQLVDRYAGLVWSVCLRYRLADADADADDVSQAVWLRTVEQPGPVSADFHAASSTLVSGELVAESSVAPPGDGDGGEFGLA